MRNKILLIVNDKEFLRKTSVFLQQNGYDVLTAMDQNDGFQMAKDESPDLIVVDVELANKTEALDAADAMQDDAATRNIPVILISGESEKLGTIQDGKLADYKIFGKNIPPEGILEIISQYMAATGKEHRRVVGELDDVAQKWKGKKGNLIMVLHEIQNRYGYVPRDVSFELSRILDIPLARIYEVITFYNYFKLDPPGKHTISVCLGTACYLKGTPLILREIKNVLNIQEDQTTKDGLFHLQLVRCLGCCGLAPVVMIDDKVYGKVKSNEVMDIISKYARKPEAAAK
ncbi:MAG: NAD(P)H-dependent oxidoreductase subunit E [Candidatus Omnitrophica bacterium]|nr:NAD(P)H-dependent oxidoreductase subunit E [Candidatus Omnitrophota bacterium]